MSIRWRMPGTNTYVLIPDSAFVEGPLPLAGTAPNKPTNLVANPASYNRVNLSWTDNSNDEAKFEVFRSTDSSAGFASVAVLPANTTSFSDTLVAASTKYFYRVRAANQYGESDFDRVGSGVSYAYYEVDGMTATPDFSKLIPKSTGVITNFNLGVQDRADNFAMRYKSVINIPTTGNYTFYTRSDDGSKLFIDGQYVVQNDFVQGSTERSGTVNNLSAGPHVIEVHYFEVGGSEVLIVNYAGPSIPKGLIPDAILGQVPVSVTTPVGPAAPAAPGGLAVKGISSSSIRVTWTYANIANANSLELYRSFNDNQNYVLLATLPVSTVLYLDTALYPSSLFYYKVRAVGVGGPSSYTDEKSARSLGVIPSIKPIEDIYMRFNSQLVVPLEATSGSPTAISLSLTNKPAFATFDSTGNGMGNLTLNPAESDQGTYTITLTAKNSQGNAYSVQFKVIVNSNYVPDIATVSNQSVNEKQTKQVMLSATDGDAADILSWSLGANTPSFATIASNNRTATISLVPGYSDAGTYKVLVLVNDGRNGKDTLSFNLTVVDVATSGDDGTAPTKVKDLAGSFVTNLNAVRLTWTNTAYNAQRNEVYRSTSISGAYTLLNPAATNKDSTAYTDSSAAGNRIYYYVVRTVNNNGSENSSRIQVSTPNKAPVISVAETLYVKATNSATVNIVTTDDPGETIAVAFSGLPSFATYSSTGNGTGNLNLHPNNSQVGSYNISVVATDDYGVSTTKVLRIVVTDSYYTNVYLKFNTVNNPYPNTLWNSMNATMKSGQTTANFTLSNLKDETQTATGINCTLVDTWPEHTSGIVTGNNSGVYPDEVLRTGYHFYVKDIVPQKVIRFSGLNANKRYNFTFFASRSASTPQVSNYTIGTETVSLDSRNNTSNTVKISGIAPDANGQVQVVVDAAMGKYGVINGMVIQYYDANTVSPPSRLKVALSEKTAVNLAWENNTQGITGFEVWRSDAANGTFVQLPGTVASNVFTYKDAGLSPGSTFYYKVRSILPSGFSEFSDVVRGSTLLYAISVNFNDGSANGPAASAPWNNTNLLVYEGYTLSNMINDANQYSGIDMTVVGSLNSFSGLNRQDNTMTTGDNSGFVPDVVMSTFYFLEYTQVGKLKLSGLNKSLKYNFIFFSACKDRGVPQITTYSVGNESVNLDAKNNISNFAAINNIIPDENGEALISLTPAAQGGFGYIGSLIIQAIPSDEAGGSSSARKATGTASNGAGSALVNLGNDAGNDNANIIIGAYPNPIVEDITIKFSLKKAEQRAVVTVRDITGKPVFTKTLNNLPAGESNQKIGINARRLMPGLYSVQVQALSNNERASIMVVK